MLKIIHIPNKILNSSVKPVAKIDNDVKKLITDMEKTLIAQNDPPGVGLAAPQVGEPLAIFIVKPTQKAKTKVFINPKVLSTGGVSGRAPASAQDRILSNDAKVNARLSNEPQNINSQTTKSEHLREGSSQQAPSSKNVKLEGCLSIPRIWSPVKRTSRIFLEYQILTGEVRKDWFQGFEAIIIQHELDHLNGILFTQRSIEQNLPLYEEKNGELERMEY